MNKICYAHAKRLPKLPIFDVFFVVQNTNYKESFFLML